jgi:hypothetical protein
MGTLLFVWLHNLGGWEFQKSFSSKQFPLGSIGPYPEVCILFEEFVSCISWFLNDFISLEYENG